MSELDEAWRLGLAEAEARARAAGRADVSAYLSLRSANDLIRKIGCDWLVETVYALAAEANDAGAGIQVTREDAYRFKAGNSSMVGSGLSLGKGVRALLLEVGWPRTPRDGVIRGGGLALANIRHLGLKAAGEKLRLVLDAAGLPHWVLEEPKSEPVELHEADLRKHLNILLNDSRSSTRHSERRNQPGPSSD